MDATILPVLNTLYGLLKDRPDLAITVILLAMWLLERSERKAMTSKNFDLIGKMQDQNKDTNDLLGQIRFLLEVLTKGRR